MKHPVLTLLIFVIFLNKSLFSQSLVIKPKFAIGDSLSYIVTEKERSISSLIVLSKGMHQFQVNFKILDTADGYTINFSTKLLQPINKKFVFASALDKLRDGISITYKLNNSGWLIDIINYNDHKLKAIATLDSIILLTDSSTKEYRALQVLLKNIEKPDGLQFLLEPIILFNEIYLAPPFRNQKDYRIASTSNIFSQPQLTGTMITNLVKLEKQSETAKLSVDFIANGDSAAKKLIPIFREMFYSIDGKVPGGLPDDIKFETHAQYDFQTSRGYPLHLFKKTVTTYIVKYTSEIQMDMIRE
jgi:hypothetical protein